MFYPMEIFFYKHEYNHCWGSHVIVYLGAQPGGDIPAAFPQPQPLQFRVCVKQKCWILVEKFLCTHLLSWWNKIKQAICDLDNVNNSDLNCFDLPIQQDDSQQCKWFPLSFCMQMMHKSLLRSWISAVADRRSRKRRRRCEDGEDASVLHCCFRSDFFRTFVRVSCNKKYLEGNCLNKFQPALGLEVKGHWKFWRNYIDLIFYGL